MGTLVVVYFIDLAEKRKSGGKYKNFYLLEETEDNELLALSFKGTKENAAGVLFTSLLSFQRTELKKAVQTELQLPLRKWLQAVPKEWKAKRNLQISTSEFCR